MSPNLHRTYGIPRTVEFLLSVAALVLALPLILLGAALVALTSGFPVFFRQERVGLLGRPFMLLKLRTMTNSLRGPQVTSSSDARITPIGKILRRTKLDELPQLWNVVRGELPLVGPRPEVPRYVNPENDLWREVLCARPGITDPVTLVLRDEGLLLASASGDPELFYLERIQPCKLSGYIRYLRSRTWKSDCEVLLATVVAILRPGGSVVALEDLEKATRREAPFCRIAERKPRVATLWRRVYEKIDSRYSAFPEFVPRLFQFVADFLILSAALGLAYLIRFDFSVPHAELVKALHLWPAILAVQYAAIMCFHLHRVLWRYVTIADARSFVRAGILSGTPVLLARFVLPASLDDWRVPLSVTALDSMLMIGGMVGLRVLRRSLHQGRPVRTRPNAAALPRRERVLLFGAGDAGRMVAQELGDGRSDVEIVGFVDDDPRKQRSVVSGVEVFGNSDSLPLIAAAMSVDTVIVTIRHPSRQRLKEIFEICERIPVKTRTLPPMDELLKGRITLERFREVNIGDLLRRPAVTLDQTARQGFFAGKSVMVTGAGGSIGSELARQVATLAPCRLMLVERSEFALFTIHRELQQAYPAALIQPVLADIGDRCRMRQVFAETAPQIVIHAAAHKHVPMIEENPSECVTNNILATQIVGTIAGESGVEAFVLISTDKAVRPTSLMGASKRITELAIQALNQQFNTRYVAVRFGNVIGSTGSVIPTFREQIRRGGPVTITHPDMVRYFMTIPEAASLVLEAATMGQGGEIFVLDMGTPVRILDLAKDLISLSGFIPYEDIDIVVTGMRPGEKLYEELELNEEAMTTTRHSKIFIGKLEPRSPQQMQLLLLKLRTLAHEADEYGIRLALSEAIPESNLLGGKPRIAIGRQAIAVAQTAGMAE